MGGVLGFQEIKKSFKLQGGSEVLNHISMLGWESQVFDIPGVHRANVEFLKEIGSQRFRVLTLFSGELLFGVQDFTQILLFQREMNCIKTSMYSMYSCHSKIMLNFFFCGAKIHP